MNKDKIMNEKDPLENKSQKIKKGMYEAKEELMVQLFGIGFVLYFIFTLLMLPFEILYSYILHLLGKEKHHD